MRKSCCVWVNHWLPSPFPKSALGSEMVATSITKYYYLVVLFCNGSVNVYKQTNIKIGVSMEKEEYRDVVGFEEYFQVSNLGNVFSKRSKRLFKQTKSPKGYWTFVAKIGGRQGTAHYLRVHRLVAEAFIPNPEGKPFVNHIDGCKTNNVVSNLEWVTAKENSVHAWATGLQLPRPSTQRKLTDDQVCEIRTSTKTNRELASIYGIDPSNIWRIKRRETYKDVPDIPQTSQM